MTALIEMTGCDISQVYFTGAAPLSLAASGRHEGVVRLLLGREEAVSDKLSGDG